MSMICQIFSFYEQGISEAYNNKNNWNTAVTQLNKVHSNMYNEFQNRTILSLMKTMYLNRRFYASNYVLNNILYYIIESSE